MLVQTYRKVLVRAAYDNYVRIRFRADKLKDPRCFFNKVPSQRKRWEEKGGALITWRNDNREGPCDALLFVECPKSMQAMLRALENTRSIGVIYEPPTWRQHEQQLAKRFQDRPAKHRKHMERLRILQAFVERLPELTRHRLEAELARQGQSQSSSSSAPERSEVVALPSGTDC